MRKRLAVGVVSCLVCWALADSPAAGQSNDIVFAGTALSTLRSCAHPVVNYVRLCTPLLRRNLGVILNDPPKVPLVALIVPASAGPDNPVVWQVFDDGTTRVQPLAVAPEDISELRTITRDNLVMFFQKQGASTLDSNEKTEKLLETIAAVPKDRRSEGRRFAGAVLAERGVKDPRLSDLAKEFQVAAIADLTKDVTASGISRTLKPGKAYVYGTQPVSERQLLGIAPGNVVELNLGSEKLNYAWIGSSAVLVKPTGAKRSKASVALDVLGLRAEDLPSVTEVMALPSRNLPSLGMGK